MPKELKKIKNTPSSIVPIYAAIDVGSNNVRMDMYGLDAAGHLTKAKITEETLFPCKLAEGMSEKHTEIKKENLALAVAAMSAFDAILTTYKIETKNTCAIMTEAMRVVQNTPQGAKTIAQLATAFHNRPFTIITGEEEATLVGRAVKISCPKGWNNLQGKKCDMAFASIGGGSIELGSISAKGKIRDAIALPFGIHPLIEKSDNDITSAKKILKQALRREDGLQQSYDILAVMGGNWRALGEAICKSPLPATLNGGTINATLDSAMRRSKKQYEALGGRPKKRAEFMQMAAATLQQTVDHFDAKKILFLETTVRDAMAHQMHALSTGKFTRPSRGLERLFSPSAP
jgi:exopolyphosphatase/pppGpp-phosphohydrolase